VVIVLREQRSMIVSSYREYVRMGGTTKFSRFLLDPNVSEGFVDDASPRNSHAVEFFKYSRLVGLYQELFGTENVHVDLMERLKSDGFGFRDDLCGFLGVGRFAPPDEAANVQLSDAALGVLRRLNYLSSNRLHRRYGPMPIARLLAVTLARGQMADWEVARENPCLLDQRISNHLRRRLAEDVMPRLDRLLRPFSGRGFRWESMKPELREWLEEEYRADNERLRERVRTDLHAHGYLLRAT
jgi:hypothetical protein